MISAQRVSGGQYGTDGGIHGITFKNAGELMDVKIETSNGKIISVPNGTEIVVSTKPAPQFTFEIVKQFIKVPMGTHIISINTENDDLFFDYDKVNKSIGRLYSDPDCKPINKGAMKKRRVLAVPDGNSVIVIDIGYDYRIFLLSFPKEKYKKFRGEPDKQYSYWNDGKRKAFYEGDLHNATWVK